MNEFIQFAILGIGAAAAYTLLGSGVILINRGSGVVNFAQAAIAMVGALIYLTLERLGAPAFLGVIIAVAGTSALGLIIYQLIMRPLGDSSPLARTICTLGVLILIQGIAALIWGVNPMQVQAIFPRGTAEFGEVAVSIDRIVVLAIAGVVVLLLWLGSRYTAIGLALRAMSENPRATSTLGWSPNRLGSLTWTVGAGLAGLAGVLIAPFTGIVISAMPLLIIPVLAVVLLANFKSFPWLFVAALGIGIGQSLTFNYVPVSGAQQSLPFVVILIVLVLRGKEKLSRSRIAERLPMVGTGRVPWIPVAVIVVVVAAGILLLFNNIFLAALTATFGWSLIVLSVVILIGYTGQLSLAQATLAGMGGLIAAKSAADVGIPFLLAIVIGIVGTILIGLLFALPALRTRGINLAIVTLGIASIVSEIFFKEEFFTGPFGVVRNTNVTIFGLDISTLLHPERYAIFALIVFVAASLMVAAVRRGTSGGRLLAVRTNDRAAATLGISVIGAKLYSFGLAAGVAAAGGIILAFSTSSFNVSAFEPFQSITTIAYAFVGGVGFVIGAPAGGQFAPGSFGSWFIDLIAPGASGVWLQLISGATLILFILLQPDGFARDWVRGAARISKRFARRSPHTISETSLARENEAGAEAAPLASTAGLKVDPVRLEVENLGVKFGAVVAVNGVSFSVEPGQVVALIGPNGAGKTTCIDAITGFVTATGTVALNGQDISRLPTFKRSRLKVRRSFQSLELFESLTVLDNLLIAADEGKPLRYFTDLVRPRKPTLGPLAWAVVDEFGLRGLLDTKVEDLSYGARRLVAVARSMASEPSVLLLDEPAAGLGDEETAEFEQVIRKIAGWGVAVLLVEHDMGLVMGVSDRVVVMETGKRLAIGTPAEIQANPQVIAAYLGQPTTTEGAAASESSIVGEVRA
jgi:sulfate-transporting ATPase